MGTLSVTRRSHLPLVPLLHAYRAEGLLSLADLHRLPTLGPRFAAILGASTRFLYPDFLDHASEDTFREALLRFYDAVVAQPFHRNTVQQRANFIRHGLAHLLHCREPISLKLEACVSPSGCYRVAGLGPTFWSAVVQGVTPGRFAAWTLATQRGANRLAECGTDHRPSRFYADLLELHGRLRLLAPEMTALHLDHFLTLVGAMSGRRLIPRQPQIDPVADAAERVRSTTSLRQRLKQRGEELVRGQQLVEAALQQRDIGRVKAAVSLVDPVESARRPLDWTRETTAWLDLVEALWRSDDPYSVLETFWQAEPIAGVGPWLPTALLHLRDPQQFLPFSDPIHRGIAAIDDALDPAETLVQRYRLANETAIWLREEYILHPLELPEVLAALAEQAANSEEFDGFCPDTFAFLGELRCENRREWMDRSRARYFWAVREPLTQLCRTLANRYVEPILGGLHGWTLDTTTRIGRTLTSICKNNFGKTPPYNSTLWITFCRPGREGVQLFVRLDPEGLRCGLRLNRSARADRSRLRHNLARYWTTLEQLLTDNGALQTCQIEDLHSWTAASEQEAAVSFPASDPVVESEELVGRILVVFDQLLPLFAACIDDDAGPALARLGGTFRSTKYTESDFYRETYLNSDWLRRARELLAIKRQLVLQGVPGTGKTHVARCLARLLTGGQDDSIRLVQFHPAYNYEEFVEGIRVRTVQVEGRQEITYPVEDGLLTAFAARAAAKPAQPHVLIIDEMNRGNLPRIFGELLYLLEYRGQAVELPYSRRDFRLPENLYLIATMNGTDRSLSLVDQALRRRFSFLQMEPSVAVLSAWLAEHPPRQGADLTRRVVTLFERLNARLLQELGPQALVGHSFFMTPQLDEAKLDVIWQHHVRPWLEELFAGQPGRLSSYNALWSSVRGAGSRNRGREPVPLAVPGERD